LTCATKNITVKITKIERTYLEVSVTLSVTAPKLHDMIDSSGPKKSTPGVNRISQKSCR